MANITKRHGKDGSLSYLIRVFLDESLRLFDPVYPAAGATNNAVEISLADLERVTGAAWVDICKTA